MRAACAAAQRRRASERHGAAVCPRSGRACAPSAKLQCHGADHRGRDGGRACVRMGGGHGAPSADDAPGFYGDAAPALLPAPVFLLLWLAPRRVCVVDGSAVPWLSVAFASVVHCLGVLYAYCIADAVQKERLEELASKEGRVDLYNYCHKVGRSTYEVLRDFPAARPGLEYLMELIPALRPRLFSISSGPSSAANRLAITAGIVEYKSKTLMDRKGVCTSFLKAQGDLTPQLGVGPDEEGRVPIWLKPGSLRLPKNPHNLSLPSPPAPTNGHADEGDEYMEAQCAELSTPLILVGPGTGLAPLRAYLQERSLARRWLVCKGRSAPGSQDLLFFGCRTQESDFLYREELEGLVASQDLMHLGVAFSRDQAKKIYVQDKVREAGAQVWQALEAGGVIMVSGSSEKMPQDVREAFVSVVEQQAQQGRQYAEDYVKRLEIQRRYLQDTWS
eukprot:Tamp_06304.p1 GENE.Tamp_06304~~Tamp_06304.p1  ORF type:complete len:447 (+),score=82.52 Tamp_06304:638-1978(+)